MEPMISRGGLHRLPRDLHRDQNPLPLKPFRSKTVFVIGPFALRNDAPGRWLQNDCSTSKFVEGEHASPFRRVPEGGDRVREDRQDTPFRGVGRPFAARAIVMSGVQFSTEREGRTCEPHGGGNGGAMWERPESS